MVWSGRQLTALTRDMLDHTLSFDYNADGVRIRKSNSDYVNSQWVDATHEYTLNGATILREKITTTLGLGANATTSTDVLYYFYDAAGSITGFEYNGTPYYFQKNLQGDIVRILNASGQVVTEYTYDAWGKVLSVTGTLASTVGQINPFRYRGYYYDRETGFYYLQTRYYDPEVGRFLNADDAALIGANGGIQGYNLFAYCNNNPVMYSDPSGEGFWDTLKEIGKSLVKGATAALAVVGTVAAVVGAATLFVGTGGGAAVLAPVIVAVIPAVKVVAVATVTTAAIGATAIAAGEIGSNVELSRTSTNQMQQQVAKGQAPGNVDSVHKAHQIESGGQDHIHFKDGSSMNADGTVHDKLGGKPRLTNKIKRWLAENGWPTEILDK